MVLLGVKHYTTEGELTHTHPISCSEASSAVPCWRTICDTEHRPDGHDANDTTGDGTLAASPRSFCFGRKQPFQSRYVQNKDTYIYIYMVSHTSK